jgi:hypothetical protein
MATLVELQAQLASLEKARGSGALIVRHGDTQVTYRSMDELIKAINIIIGLINEASGIKRKPRYIRQTSKGL